MKLDITILFSKLRDKFCGAVQASVTDVIRLTKTLSVKEIEQRDERLTSIRDKDRESRKQKQCEGYKD